MGKKKNELKNKFNYCFSCGCELEHVEDKIIHRINKYKNVSENNIVILCKDCKKYFSSGEYKIYDIKIPKEILKKYFINLDKKYKKIILMSLQYQRDKYEE